MLTSDKVKRITDGLMKAIQTIEKEENVKIKLDKSTLAYNKGQLSFSVVEDKVDKYEDMRLKSICQSIGFTQNVIGLEFEFRGFKYQICNIKLRNRKYPVIALNTRTGLSYKFDVSTIKSKLGGDKLINRSKNLDVLVDLLNTD